jgi:hypothetical protein
MVGDLVRRAAAVLTLGTLGFGLAGCSEDPIVDSSPPPRPAEAGEVSADLPSSRSGGLGKEHLPEPHELGRGWKYRVDHGNPEDGYRGSGEPATAREPNSVLAAITPLGCRPAQLPQPRSALEVTYARGELPGVGLLLRFDNEASARRFFSTHAQVLERCVVSRHIDLRVEERNDSLIVTTRTEELGRTPAWTEGMSQRGTDVMLVAVADPSKRSVRSVMAAMT